MTPTDKTDKNVDLEQMVACVEFLSEYFGHIAAAKLQYTEEFGCALSLEADGLTFDMSQPRHGNFDLMVYSAEDTEIKLACVSLPLDDDGQIGPDALSAIKLRQEAITPEGRKRLLKLNRSSFGKLYQDLHPARWQRRGQLLTERCMRHTQASQPGPQCSDPKVRRRPESQHVSAATSAMLSTLCDGNVTVLKPEYLKHLLAAFDNGAPYTGIRDVSSIRRKPFSLVGPLAQGPFDTYSVTKTTRQFIPLLYVLPEENKPHDYRGEGPTNQ